MKKIFIFLLLMIFIPSMFMPIRTQAKTIADLKAELDKILKEEAENNANIELNDSELASIQSEISDIYNQVENITSEMKNIEEEIVQLEEDIVAKDKSSKNLMSSLQTTTGNSFYIEYLFGATSITDFIYRYSITEQITSYNDKLINEMNEMIKESKEKKEELSNKQKELENRQNTLTSKMKILEDAKVKLYELGSTLEQEIINAKAVIKMYQDKGCGEYDDISVCASNMLPPDTKFWRPFETGYVTSEFGYRNAIYDGNGNLIASSGLHEGIDLSNSLGSKNPMYSIANGIVARIWYDIWGGNQITIHHNVNGKAYSSSYAHMSKITVKEGDIVTKDTIVGYMGSTGNVTGPHLHLAISTGLRFTEYTGYSAYVARCVNPRNLINFPSYGSWKDRVTKF